MLLINQSYMNLLRLLWHLQFRRGCLKVSQTVFKLFNLNMEVFAKTFYNENFSKNMNEFSPSLRKTVFALKLRKCNKSSLNC